MIGFTRSCAFLSSKEPAWKDEDHPEMKDSVEWVRKLRPAEI
jgi:hypothetical protein